LETLVVTHVPFSVLAENSKVAFRERFDEDAADYESHVAMFTRRRRRLAQPDEKFTPFPLFAAWIGREVPEGATISAAYTSAWQFDRRDERNTELQQVSLRASGDPASLDHTFATIKNLYAPFGLERVTAVFDMVNNKKGPMCYLPAPALRLAEAAAPECAPSCSPLRLSPLAAQGSAAAAALQLSAALQLPAALQRAIALQRPTRSC
jgi:hypothetical protein